METEQAYWMLNVGRWTRNTNETEMVRRIGEVLLSESPDNAVVLATVAQSRYYTGRQEEAIPLVREALDDLMDSKLTNYQDRKMISDLITIMSPREKEKYLADLDERIDIEGVSLARLFIRGQLLDSLDRTALSLENYRKAYELSSDNLTLSREYILAMRDDGRDVALSRVLSANLKRSSLMESFQWRSLTDIYRNLFDPIRGIKTARRDQTSLGQIDTLQLLDSMNKRDEAQTAFRRFLIQQRNNGRFSMYYWPEAPGLGGLIAFLEKQGKQKNNKLQEQVYLALADLPASEMEYAATLRAVQPDRQNVTGLIEGLVRANQLNHHRQILIDNSTEYERRDALNIVDRQMLHTLYRENPTQLPELLHQPAQASLSTLTIGSAEDLNNLIHVLPPAEQLKGRTRITKLFSPTPLNVWSDEIVLKNIESLEKENNPSSITKELDRLRSHYAKSPTTDHRIKDAIARLAAAADQYDVYLVTIKKIFDEIRYDQSSGKYDVRQLLPPASKMKDSVRYLQALIKEIKDQQAAEKMKRSDATRNLVLIGVWCKENNLTDPGQILIG